MLKKFHYLGKGLAFILAFIGVKLFLQAGGKVISTSIPEIPSLVSLGVIVIALTVSIIATLRNPLPDDGSDVNDDPDTAAALQPAADAVIEAKDAAELDATATVRSDDADRVSPARTQPGIAPSTEEAPQRGVSCGLRWAPPPCLSPPDVLNWATPGGQVGDHLLVQRHGE